ncbi:MAG: HNH endonuclease signature motif containing protein [Xanthobacteraceae bacterium]
MPVSAPKHCPAGHAPFRGPRCPVCAAKQKAAAEQRRPSAREGGYDSAWRAKRAAFLLKHPRCACGAVATVVDHVRPHKGDARLFNDPNNWAALCASCHSRQSLMVVSAIKVVVLRVRPGGGRKLQ